MASLTKRVRAAINDAFTSYDQLRLMVGEGNWSNLTNVQLEKIAKPDAQDIVVFNLVEWARRNGRLAELLTNCVMANPGHPGLRSLAEEVSSLKEQTLSSDGDVSIDDQEYPQPPAPLTDLEKRRLAWNAGALCVLIVETLAWTMLLIDNAWMFWTGTVLAAVLPKAWEMLTNRPVQLKATSIARRILTHRAVWPALIASILAVTTVTLFIAPVKYLAPVAAPWLQEGSSDIAPEKEAWTTVSPLGREAKFEIAELPALHQVLYPWQRNRVYAPPLLIVQPTFDITAIGTEETNEALWWTLKVRITRDEVEKHHQTVRPYLGGPLILNQGAAQFNGSPYPPEVHLLRLKYAVECNNILALPGDSITIDIAGPSENYSRTYTVQAALGNDPLYQVIRVPK